MTGAARGGMDMHGLSMVALGVALLAGCQPAVAPAAVPAPGPAA